MYRSRALSPGHPLRRAAARVLLVLPLLAPVTTERLHNHAALVPQPCVAASPAAGIAENAEHLVPDPVLPCLACPYPRAFSVDSPERAPDAQAAVSLGEWFPSDPPPPVAPIVVRAGPRAPPA